MKTTLSYLVKLNKTEEYFEVSFTPMNAIERIKMVKSKKNATVFQPDAHIIKFVEGDFLHKIYNDCFGVSEINIGKQRMGSFSLALAAMGIKKEDITIESFEAEEQSLFSKTQEKELKEDFKLLDEFSAQRNKK